MKNLLKSMGLLKKNYKNELIPAAAGIIFVIAGAIIWTVYLFFDIGQFYINQSFIFLTIIIGLTGFVDDLAGSKDSQGFKGHFQQLLSGNLTSGAFKAFIAFITILFVIISEENNFFDIFINTALILLMTNFLNLLDLRPGRSLKFFILFSLLLITITPTLYIYYLPLFIILVPYIYYELKGKVMLGDTGSNALGVILGYGFSHWDNIYLKAFLVLFIGLLTILSEKYSFTGYIAGNKYLYWLDMLGRD